MSSLKNTGIVGGMTLASRVLGLVRDVVFARFFGAGPLMDAFFVAFKIPNFFRRLTAEGAFSQAFVPVLSEYRQQRPAEEVRALADGVWGTLGLLLLVVTAIGVLAAPVLIFIFAPGFADEPEQHRLASAMLRLTFPYLLFISLTALAAGLLNSYGRFAVPAFTPVLLNVVLISFAIAAASASDDPGLVLALGVFVAGLVQLAFQLPFLARIGLFPRPRWGWPHEGVQRIGRLMVPALFGSSVAQINLLLDTLIASFLAAGSISWLYYSDRLVEFPLGVFGIALATVILPRLSTQHARSAPREFAATLDWALRLTCLIGVPATIGMLVLAEPMLSTIFQYGDFTARDVEMAGWSLRAYSIGLCGFILVKVLAPGYYSRQDTRTPVRVGIIALAVNMALNIIFVVLLVLLGVPAPHAGLALATALAAWLNAGLLFRGLRRSGVFVAGGGWGRLAGQIGLAATALAGALVWAIERLGPWTALGAAGRVWRLAVCVAGGAALYFAVLWLLGLRPRHLRERPAV